MAFKKGIAVVAAAMLVTGTASATVRFVSPRTIAFVRIPPRALTGVGAVLRGSTAAIHRSADALSNLTKRVLAHAAPGCDPVPVSP